MSDVTTALSTTFAEAGLRSTEVGDQLENIVLRRFICVAIAGSMALAACGNGVSDPADVAAEAATTTAAIPTTAAVAAPEATTVVVATSAPEATTTPTPTPTGPVTPVTENADGITTEEPTVWNFVSGPVNFRATPSIEGEIIGSWAGEETGILGTGRIAEADGFDWVELAAGEERQAGWVARDFIEPDPTYDGILCYQTDDTAMVLEFNDDAETFVGGVRTPTPGSVDYFGVAGRRFDGTMFDVRVENTRSGDVSDEEWGAFRDGFSTELGLLEITDCVDMSSRVGEINAIVTAYPAVPAN